MDIVFAEKPKTSIFKDIEKEKFGRLLVIGFAGRLGNKSKHSFWRCKCDCGNIVRIRYNRLVSYKTRSCGCLMREARIKHNKSQSPEYKSYQCAKARCINPSDHAYKDYGGRGIEFRFKSFEEFYAELRDKPEPKYLYSVDRIDNNGHYEKGNVRWATTKIQGKNKRNIRWLTYDNRTQSLEDWSIEVKIKKGTIRSRLNQAEWCVECSLTIPVHVNRIKYPGCPHRK